MKAIPTYLKSVLFLGVYLVSWTIIPVLLLLGALTLFLYALAVESLHSLIGKRARERAASPAQDRRQDVRVSPQIPTWL
jgi:hypothetical protein